VNVRAQGLLNAAAWIEQRYGREMLAEVLASVRPATRERYVTAIAIEWHPLAEFIDFMEVAERVTRAKDGALAREMGANGARQNLKGVVKRSLFYLASPDYLLRRIAGLWQQFNDRGAMHLRHLDDRYGILEVEGVPEPHRLFCATLTGWTEVVAEAVGFIKPQVQHRECRASGDERCLWHVTWAHKADGSAASWSVPPGKKPG
jgi:hypothetical protein